MFSLASAFAALAAFLNSITRLRLLLPLAAAAPVVVVVVVAAKQLFLL